MTRAAERLYLPQLYRIAIGYDRIFDELGMALEDGLDKSGYPPYNIVQVAEDKYLVELAVAGFQLKEISVSCQNGMLLIVGHKGNEEGDPNRRYLYKGIGSRQFRKTITLASEIVVTGASMGDGILVVECQKLADTANSVKIIPITNR